MNGIVISVKYACAQQMRPVHSTTVDDSFPVGANMVLNIAELSKGSMAVHAFEKLIEATCSFVFHK